MVMRHYSLSIGDGISLTLFGVWNQSQCEVYMCLSLWYKSMA